MICCNKFTIVGTDDIINNELPIFLINSQNISRLSVSHKKSVDFRTYKTFKERDIPICLFTKPGNVFVTLLCLRVDVLWIEELSALQHYKKRLLQ